MNLQTMRHHQNTNEVLRCPAGFTAAAATCGIKPSGKPDLALIHCTDGASAAAVFTTNLVRAAPLDVSADHLRASGGCVRALMINSGCANAATGAEGRRRALRTVTELASRLRCKPAEILINSTGVIGVQLSDDKIVSSLDLAVASASSDGLQAAAKAIMTTDTRMKTASIRVDSDKGSFNVAGIAKGSGMIHPNMATLIAVILTDAAAAPPALNRILRAAVERSFHRISVDGDTSTNDSVFLLASGKAGAHDDSLLADAVARVAQDLALQVVRDGEGAKRLIHVQVSEARISKDALQVARTVAGSLLVRTAVAGGDPNWGRILAAIGRSGVAIEVERIAVAVGGVPLFAHGAPTVPAADRLASIFTSNEVTIDIRLGLGDAHDEFFTCDLTEDYVHINADYTT